MFLAHPNLHRVVGTAELSYITSLLVEFLVRAKFEAEQLFHRLCSQASGPLLPWKIGDQLEQHPDIRDLAMQFLPL